LAFLGGWPSLGLFSSLLFLRYENWRYAFSEAPLADARGSERLSSRNVNLRRRDFLLGSAAAPFLGAAGSAGLSFRLTDVSQQAGIFFVHNTGAFGGRYLPETLGPGCAFFDYDADGWQDILILNGMDWPGHKKRRTTLALYHNNRNGTFTDVTRSAGLDFEFYGLGVAAGDYDNDGFPDLYLTGFGQNRLLHNNGKGAFVDVTPKSGLGGRAALSTSALWFDYDRDGLLDLFVCNYVRWSPELDVFCSLDGKHKSYCTPEVYHGTTCWLFHNRGDGTFEDVTAHAGLLDTSSKSLGVAMFDYDNDGWPDLIVANDTQPNKLYRNKRNGTFEEIGMTAGIAFSEDGKARAGMGVDVADYDNTGRKSIVITNFDNEMLALYQGSPGGMLGDLSPRSELGRATRRSLGFGCFFFDVNLAGPLDLLVVNGHIDDSVRSLPGKAEYAQQPQLFLQDADGKFRDVAAEAGAAFAAPKVGRGAAYGDFNNDGALDVLITTNGGPAFLYRNDLANGNRALRLKLVGTKSNRDAIGARVEVHVGSTVMTRMVRSGSSYLSQSELPLTFGTGHAAKADRVAVFWPSGRVDEHRSLPCGTPWVLREGEKPE
jgi:hypothetical protein